MELIYILMHILLVIILLVLLLLILLLLMPIQYSLQAQLKEDYCLGIRVGCGFIYQAAFDVTPGNRCFALRLLGIRLPVNNHPKPERESVPAKTESKKKSKSSRIELKSVLNRDLFREALNLLSRSYHHIKPSRIHLQGCYGFEEPHYTAWMLPLIGLVNGWDSAVIDLLPIWDEACLDMDLDIQGQIIPGFLLLFGLRLLISRPMRRIIRDKWKSKKIKNHYMMQQNGYLAGK